jgi:hydroxypyruvate isomerase
VGGPLALTGHIRIADVPGRNEPGTGEMNYPFVLDHINRMGHTGAVGLAHRGLLRLAGVIARPGRRRP